MGLGGASLRLLFLKKRSSSTPETSEQTPPHSCLSLLGGPAESPPPTSGHALLALEGGVGGRKDARCYRGWGLGQERAPMALELQCAACGSGVSSSPAEHK